MFLGDMIWGNSGYSKVIYYTCRELLKFGHEIAHIPMGRAMMGGKLNYQGVLVYPSGDDAFGEDVALKHYLDFNAGMLITVKEPWAFHSTQDLGLNFVPMAIIDHSPISPIMVSRFHNAYKVISISMFGERELKNKNIESCYIPHGVDLEIYKPASNKSKCKSIWYIEDDDFTVGIIAMNRIRKMIPRMLRGYKMFLDQNKGIKSHLILWSGTRPIRVDPTATGVGDYGVNLIPEIAELNLSECVRWPDESLVQEGIPESTGVEGSWDMATLYNSFDVLLHCTGGEGFGLPLLESQACGVPVITTGYAAASELVGSGYTVEATDYVIINTPGTRYALPDIDGMADALTKVYNERGSKMSMKARVFAERYSWERIAKENWKPFLEECETELKPLITKEGVKHW